MTSSNTFESLLIANRGEIACRIIRTCRRLGIRSIAVYSEADKDARHVREADEALFIGRADSASSYLNPRAIIRAALQSTAAAIHPGYGFLSEKSALPILCAENGIVWVGPRAEVIEQMGSKIESKRIAESSGVACVPGYHGEQQDSEHLLEQAGLIGWPVLIKASAGGGGRGMRQVLEAGEFTLQLEQARQEAKRAFGDDRVLIEKLLLRPRHVEVQLAGDKHGNLVHFFERECSVQRKYQKVIEEAPAPSMPGIVRQRLLDAAVKLGRQIHYDSLGTVEFILEEGSELPYFLEMNTRLQVEHPVTELVTGVDLVELQIRVASGQVMPIRQDDIKVDGWAIEARVNCENPAQGYRAELGQISGYYAPELAGVRIDSGIYMGSRITPFYDSLVAKVIGHGRNRAQAADRLMEGLRGLTVIGIGTNQAFLAAIVDSPLFRNGQLNTGFLEQAFGTLGWQPDAGMRQQAIVAAALYRLDLPISGSGNNPWLASGGYRSMAGAGRIAAARLRVTETGQATASLRFIRDGEMWIVEIDGKESRFGAQWLSGERLQLAPAHGLTRAWDISTDGDKVTASYAGMLWRFNVFSEVASQARAAVEADSGESDGILKAVMPGVITAINAAVGDLVEVGDILIEIEAMKLIFNLCAGQGGRIHSLSCKQGDVVAQDQSLLEIKAV